MKTYSDAFYAWLANNQPSTIRDVQEALGVARGWRKIYAQNARMQQKGFHRKTNVICALREREVIQYLKPLLVKMRGY